LEIALWLKKACQWLLGKSNASVAPPTAFALVSSAADLHLSLAKLKSASTTVGAAQDQKQPKAKFALLRYIPCMDKTPALQELSDRPGRRG
jgi:hypothetical protein